MVVEYAEHGNLQAYLVKTDVPEHLKLLWAGDVAAGVAHVHDKGLLHRDIATRNVLLYSEMRCKVRFGYTGREDGVERLVQVGERQTFLSQVLLCPAQCILFLLPFSKTHLFCQPSPQLTDFGMAREVEENDVYYSRRKTSIPVRSVTTPWSSFSSGRGMTCLSYAFRLSDSPSIADGQHPRRSIRSSSTSVLTRGAWALPCTRFGRGRPFHTLA